MESKNRAWLIQGLAIFSGVIGLYILYAIIMGQYRIFAETDTVSDFLSRLLFLVFPGSIFFLASVFFMFVAIQCKKGVSSRNLRRLSIVWATIAFVLLLSILSPLEWKYFPKQSIEYASYTTPLIWILAGLFHLACNRCLHKWIHVELEMDFRKHSRAVKWYFCFLALFVITPLFDIIEPIAMQSGRDQKPLLVLLDVILGIGVLALGWGIYRFGSRIFTRKKPAEL